jgi:transposase
MEGWQMYSKIQAMKAQGFSIRQVSRIIRISRNTIRKYWEMEPQEYAGTYKTANRMTALMAYEQVVLRWLEAYPCMTAAQVRDWLDERHHVDAGERTVRRFVARLRERHGIARTSEPRREYEAVEELPKGYQMQLDFGEKTVRDAYSSRYVKLYFVVFTLSYSRYKWGIFRERPFMSADLVSALYGSFEYFGGMPRQLVYDQASIMVVSENGGDIVHTQAFATFLAETKLDVRVCRKSDPESKGLVEATVKFVKGNFMENRQYMGIDIWNRSFEDWLERTGNCKQHGTTKKRPQDMYSDEQEHLLPLYGIAPATIAEEMNRNIRPDNTVLYKANRYSVPYGTYVRVKKAYLAVEEEKLHVMDIAGDILATHEICREKGRLIRPECHRRDRGERIGALQEKTVALLGEEFQGYIEALCREKPRYVKEQLSIVLRTCEAFGREIVLAAMHYCLERNLHSANCLREASEFLAGSKAPERAQPGRLPVEDERYHVPVQNRNLSVYADVAAGSGVSQ